CDPVRRIRWMGLTLLLAVFGAVSQAIPPAPLEHDGSDALVLATGTTVQALPAPSWTLLAEAPSDLGQQRHRGPAADRPRPPRIDEDGLSGPMHPNAQLRARAHFLLGLPAAPANAPPIG